MEFANPANGSLPKSVNWDGGLETAAPWPAGDATRESHMRSRVRAWAITSAVAWAVAIWVSAYEPLVLFLIVTATALVMNRRAVFARDRRAGWILFAAIIAIAFAVERRVPSFAIFQFTGHLRNWAQHHRGTRARFTDESSLVELVRVSAVRCTGLDLDEHQNAEKRRALATASSWVAPYPFTSFSSPRISSPFGRRVGDIFLF